MEKFILTPVSIFEKIAKYNPENAKIDLLIEADDKKEDFLKKINNDPVMQSFMNDLIQRKIEIFRKKVFSGNENKPTNSMSKPIFASSEEPAKPVPVKQLFPEIKHADSSVVDSPQRGMDAEMPMEMTDADTTLTENDVVEIDNADIEHELISPRREYIINRLKELESFEILPDRTIRMQNKHHTDIDINKVVDFLLQERASSRHRQPKGTARILSFLAANPRTLITKVTYRSDLKNYMEEYRNKMDEFRKNSGSARGRIERKRTIAASGRGGGQWKPVEYHPRRKKFIMIKKLPTRNDYIL